tara:strand:- start:28581 stop:28760 length:180 start_codon:yes stop_codon:yes gene_type:complete
MTNVEKCGLFLRRHPLENTGWRYVYHTKHEQVTICNLMKLENKTHNSIIFVLRIAIRLT